MENIQNRTKIIVILTIIVLSASYITLVFNNNVWLDEAFTATLVHTSYSEVLKRSMADTLPPLYNLYLKTMTYIFGYNIIVMKITSVIPMILTMIIGAPVIYRRFNYLSAVLFSLCITGMPLMYYFGVEIRMYSLGFMFATLSGIYAYECVCESSKKNWCIFTVFSVLAGYSHHFAFVTVGFIYLALLLFYIIKDRKNIKRWFFCLLATFILYFPCLITTLKQLKSVSGYFSMPDVTLHIFIQYALYPFTVGKTSASALLLILVIAYLAVIVKKYINNSLSKNDYFAAICFVIYYGVLLFGTALSKIMTANIFVDRYLFFSTGLLWLFIAVEAGNINFSSSYLQKIVPAITVICLIYVGICSYIVQFDKEYSNDANDEIKFVSQIVQNGDTLYTIEDAEELAFCLPFYHIIGTNNEKFTNYENLSDAILASKNHTFVAIMDGQTISDTDLLTIKNNGLSLRYITSFDFDRYKCDIYRLD